MAAVIGLLALVAIPVGLIGFAVQKWRNRQASVQEMTGDQRAWFEAEKRYAQGVAAAESALRACQQTCDKNVRAAEKGLEVAKTIGRRPLGKQSSLKLFEDRVETPNGVFAFGSGQVETDVKTSGNVVIVANKKQDTRQLFLQVNTPRFQSVVPCKPDKEAEVRAFAGSIVNACNAFPRVQAEGLAAVQAAEVALADSLSTRDEMVAETEAALASTVEDRDSLELARGQVGARYCPACNANVVPTSDGPCQRGHSAEQLEAAKNPCKPGIPGVRSKNGERAMLATAGLGFVLFLIAMALSPASPQEATTKPIAKAKSAQVQRTTSSVPSESAIITAPQAVEATPQSPNPEPKPTPRPVTPNSDPDKAWRASVQSYTLQVVELSTEVQESTQEIVRYSSSWPYVDDSDTVSLAAALATIKANYTRALRMRPPKGMERGHQHLKNGMEHYDKAVDGLASGIDELDGDMIERAGQQMLEGSRDIQSATAEFESFRAKNASRLDI